MPNTPYDGRFTFVRLRYGPDYGVHVAAAALVARLPVGEQHFMKILNELTLPEPAHRGDQHPGARRSGAVQVSDRLHARAGLLGADRRGSGGVPRVPAEGRVRHRRRLPETAATGATSRRRCRASCPRRASSTSTRRTRSSTRSSRSTTLDMSRSPTTAGRPIFRGMFEDNDPAKRLMVIDQLQHRHLGVLGVSDTGLQAGRRIERGVQARRQLHHVRDDALDRTD